MAALDRTPRVTEPRTHACPAVGCDQVVPYELLACRAHWFSLPIDLRRAIARAWKMGDVAEHGRYRKVATYLLNGGHL